MKIYRILLLIFYAILISFFTFLFFLYKQDRLIILYKKNSTEKREFLSQYQEKLFGILITNKEEKKIPFSITFDSYDKNHSEDFIYTILYQFFHFINLENIGKIHYDLHHVACNHNTIIINGSLDQKIILSPQEEFLLLKSIFITLHNILPGIESIYFYDDENPLKLNYVLPFITKDIAMPNHNISKNVNNTELIVKDDIVIIPYFEGNGNSIDGVFEKNVFQQNQSILFFPKNKKGSNEYYREINQYQSDNPNKIIFFITIQQAEREQLDIVYYPVIPEGIDIYEFQNYPLRQNNKKIDNLLSLFKSKYNGTSFFSYPFMPLINIIYPSVYIIISVKNKEEIKPLLNRIKNITLY